MTPLTLNLLAEEQQAEEASARDPVKFAIIIGVVFLALTAAGGVLMMMWAEEKRTEADRLQRRWDEMTLKPTGGTFRALKLFAEDLVSIHQGRMLLAPQLARMKDLVPDSIFLTRAGFRMDVEMGRTSGPTAVEGGGASPRGQNMEQLLLRLDGTAVGARPEIEVDKFLKTLRSDASLSNQVTEVALRSIGFGASSTDNGQQTMTAQFVIECVYKESK